MSVCAKLWEFGGVMIIKIWLMILLATLASWYVLKLVNNPKPLLWVFLFWLGVIVLSALLLYFISVFVAS
jgi:hypothetical protein